MNVTDIQGTVTLRNGIPMPYFGLGVFQIDEGRKTIDAVRTALELGYRHIDTAANYGNETSVAIGIQESGINRNDIFITTKVWNSDHGYDNTLRAFELSSKRLNTDYIDLYLIHWPVKDKSLQTWKAFEKLYAEKRIKAIGVSNFREHQLTPLLANCNEPPAVNQIEFHPRFNQKNLIIFCNSNGIQIEAYSPLMQGKILTIPQLQVIAKKYTKSVAQIVLRWILQKGVVAIPKSSQYHRIKENGQIFDFEISEEDMQSIDALNKNERVGGGRYTSFFRRALRKMKVIK